MLLFLGASLPSSLCSFQCHHTRKRKPAPPPNRVIVAAAAGAGRQQACAMGAAFGLGGGGGQRHLLETSNVSVSLSTLGDKKQSPGRSPGPETEREFQGGSIYPRPLSASSVNHGASTTPTPPQPVIANFTPRITGSPTSTL